MKHKHITKWMATMFLLFAMTLCMNMNSFAAKTKPITFNGVSFSDYDKDDLIRAIRKEIIPDMYKVSQKAAKTLDVKIILKFKDGEYLLDNAKGKITKNVQYFTIELDATGGIVSSKSKTVKKDAAYGTLPTPRRDGYIFKGWYTKKKNGSEVKSSKKCNKDSTIYAHWTKQTEYKYNDLNKRIDPVAFDIINKGKRSYEKIKGKYYYCWKKGKQKVYINRKAFTKKNARYKKIGTYNAYLTSCLNSKSNSLPVFEVITYQYGNVTVLAKIEERVMRQDTSLVLKCKTHIVAFSYSPTVSRGRAHSGSTKVSVEKHPEYGSSALKSISAVDFNRPTIHIQPMIELSIVNPSSNQNYFNIYSMHGEGVKLENTKWKEKLNHYVDVAFGIWDAAKTVAKISSYWNLFDLLKDGFKYATESSKLGSEITTEICPLSVEDKKTLKAKLASPFYLCESGSYLDTKVGVEGNQSSISADTVFDVKYSIKSVVKGS